MNRRKFLTAAAVAGVRLGHLQNQRGQRGLMQPMGHLRAQNPRALRNWAMVSPRFAALSRDHQNQPHSRAMRPQDKADQRWLRLIKCHAV
jgi:hypothetical protein